MEDGSGTMTHWRCIIIRQPPDGKTIVVHFSMGEAHGDRKPQITEVLDCLASDVAGSRDSFEDWCGSYGYDTDSRSALRIYRACRKVHTQLGKILSKAERKELLDNTDRL